MVARPGVGARARAALAGLVVVVLAATSWMLWRGGGGSSAASRGAVVPGRPVPVNRPAPRLRLPVLGGRGLLWVGGVDGGVTVVSFWASWCTACRTEMPELASLWKQYRRRSVRFVGVDYVDRTKAALAFARARGMDYPSGIDANGSAGDAFGIFGLPTTFIIGPDGRLRYVVNGKIDPASFRAALDSVLRTLSGGGAA